MIFSSQISIKMCSCVVLLQRHVLKLLPKVHQLEVAIAFHATKNRSRPFKLQL